MTTSDCDDICALRHSQESKLLFFSTASTFGVYFHFCAHLEQSRKYGKLAFHWADFNETTQVCYKPFQQMPTFSGISSNPYKPENGFEADVCQYVWLEQRFQKTPLFLGVSWMHSLDQNANICNQCWPVTWREARFQRKNFLRGLSNEIQDFNLTCKQKMHLKQELSCVLGVSNVET